MSAETLRAAAKLMRSRAEAAAKPWHPWGDVSLPERSGSEAWSADMSGYLGGEWAEHIASWHPTVALAVADWLDSEYVTWERLEDSLGARSVRAMSGGRNEPSALALAVATAYIGDQP